MRLHPNGTTCTIRVLRGWQRFHKLPDMRPSAPSRTCSSRVGARLVSVARRRCALRHVRWMLALWLVPPVRPLASVHARTQMSPGSVPQSERCQLRVLDSARVRVGDSIDVYIEPTAFVPAGKSLLLAGSPNYVPRPDAHQRPGDRLAIDSIFGAVRGPDGVWVAIPIPRQVRHFGGVRAVASGEGRWHVVFIEIPTVMQEYRMDGATIAAWHGVLTQRGWEQLERLPLPHPDTVDVLNASALLRRGDTLTWALRLRTPETRSAGGVGVLEARRGHWSFRLVEPHALTVNAAQFANGERRLFIRREAEPRKGLFQLVSYAFRPDATPLDTLLPADDVSRFLNRAYSLADGGVAYHWIEPRDSGPAELRMLALDSVGGRVGDRTIARPYTIHFPLRAGRGSAAWLVLGDRRGSGRSRMNGGWLELARVTPTRSMRVASLPHRFVAPPSLLVRDGSSIQLVGPVLHPREGGPMVGSMVVTVGYSCRD